MKDFVDIKKIFYGVLKSNEDIYLKISDSYQYFENNSNNNKNGDEIKPMYLSILTKASIDYDYANLIGENINNYEYENIDTVKYKDKKYKPYLMYYVIDNMAVMEIVKSVICESGWVTAKYVSCDSSEKHESGYLEGNLFLNALIINSGKCLKIQSNSIDDKALSKIKMVYDVGSTKFRTDLSDIQITSMPEKIRVYNVGHGNLNLIISKKACMLFDIGCPRGYSRKWESNANYKAICSSMRMIKPDFVVISHWDTDHYKGYGMLNKETFQIPWIVPNYNNESGVNVKRLIKLLDKNNCLHCLNVNIKERALFSSNRICVLLKKGNGKRDNCISERNRNGLFIELKKYSNKYLLMADTTYKCAEIINDEPVDLLVVPHHGSNTMDRTILPKPNSKNSIAIVCEDEKEYKRCDDHMRDLHRKGFKVHFISSNNLMNKCNNQEAKWFEYNINDQKYNWYY